jgi:hypothetical protein
MEFCHGATGSRSGPLVASDGARSNPSESFRIGSADSVPKLVVTGSNPVSRSVLTRWM